MDAAAAARRPSDLPARVSVAERLSRAKTSSSAIPYLCASYDTVPLRRWCIRMLTVSAIIHSLSSLRRPSHEQTGCSLLSSPKRL